MFYLVRTLALAGAVAATAAAASAQAMGDAPAAASATVPPKAPTYPVPVKPDFSSMKFLTGTWKCASHSERRGNEATLSTITYTMAPDGYFMKSLTKSPKVSYSAVGSTTTDWYTYDNDAKRWIDITVGSYGAYGYSTSTGWSNGRMLWGADSFLPNGDYTSSTGTLMTKISETKYTTKSAFTSAAGLLNRVNGSCAKQ